MIPRIPLCLLEQPAREAEADRKFRASLGLPPLPERPLPKRTWKSDAEEWCLALLVLVPPIFSMVFAGGVVWVIVLVTEAVTKSAQ